MRHTKRVPFLFCLLLATVACGGGGSGDVVNDPGGTLSASFTAAQPSPGSLTTAMAPGGGSGALVTVAINGTKIAADAAPTIRPNRSWNSISELARLASASDAATA